MQWITKAEKPEEYLEVSECINHNHIKVAIIVSYLMDLISKDLEENKPMTFMDPEIEYAYRAFLFVRDEIPHSADIGKKELPITASQVLDKRTGICFTKSHLLAALLRANGIPAGLCYQYLRLDELDDESPLVLHGLNAIFFESVGEWIRVDARGNREEQALEDGRVRPAIHSEFSINPAEEKLAFPVRPGLGETDLPFIFPRPDAAVLMKLKKAEDRDGLWLDLPNRIAGRC